MNDKKSLRKEFILKRASMPPADVKRLSHFMSAHLEQWLSLTPKLTLFLYSPIRNEPDLTSLIGVNPKVTYALPVVLDKTQMEFYAVDKATTFTANRWGILEPDIKDRARVCLPDEQSLVVIPALAADINGNRLGYGAGFYDRYLQNSKATHMISIFSEFILETLKHELHDIKAHYILSEDGVGEC